MAQKCLGGGNGRDRGMPIKDTNDLPMEDHQQE